jgi:hypothetical protein
VAALSPAWGWGLPSCYGNASVCPSAPTSQPQCPSVQSGWLDTTSERQSLKSRRHVLTTRLVGPPPPSSEPPRRGHEPKPEPNGCHGQAGAFSRGILALPSPH